MLVSRVLDHVDRTVCEHSALPSSGIGQTNLGPHGHGEFKTDGLFDEMALSVNALGCGLDLLYS